ncbi:hypothetical protein G7081_04805 [Vagococcus coleopterorum]|uniref:Uncharacterized protein n=1 Tax=Vagococcus coleopterorum TaxID=2714946 RepID=A0A6G8AND1_9ENTE|nr:DnaD domain protein [Vagococcus coleopterorum]QIL46435.1 hypothetical protein G7081_04805 [Vagococcus coleopterorum]
MNSAWKQLHPQDSFTVKLCQEITVQDERVLSYLYQPIIGIEAFGLYHALLTAIDDHDFDSQETLHSELFNQLNLDLPKIFNARVKLEGIGLLRVYEKQQDNFRHFIYELIPPLAPTNIFNDDVLSLLLLDAVGEKRFDKLVKRFAIPQCQPTGYQEVTHKFVDVFHFKGEQLASHSQQLTQTKAQFTEVELTKLSPVRDSFDWDYFMSLMNDFFLNKEKMTQEVKDTIYTLHNLYGINELTMRELVEPSVDYVTNEIKVNELRKAVIDKYHGRKEQQAGEASPALEGLTDSEQLIRRKNDMVAKGYSDADVEFILATESYSPMIYLESIKDQKRGFISDGERYAIEGLIKRSTLSDAVLNVLIHYILVVQGKPDINKFHAETIANDWAQNQIRTPEAAFEKIKEVASQQASKPKQSYSKKSYAKKGGRKETTPDWVGQTNQETRVSKEAEDRLKERIKKLREQSKEGDA